MRIEWTLCKDVAHGHLLEGSQDEGGSCGGSRRLKKGGCPNLLHLSYDAQTLAEEKHRGQGSLARSLHRGRKRRILATLEEKKALWRQLDENYDATTLERHCELWEEGAGTRVSVSTMSRAIRHKLGWTFKKRRWVPPNATRRREVLGESE